jgi:hypothetical protein
VAHLEPGHRTLEIDKRGDSVVINLQPDQVDAVDTILPFGS